MFNFDVFAEIMVVGSLLLLALTPIVVRLSPWANQKDVFLPAVDYLKEGTGRLVLALLIAYALGVAANRLIDDLLDCVGIDPGSEYSDLYEAWASKDTSRPQKLKYAEFLLRERNEATAAWFDRHKSYIRILRGAAASSLLLLLAMLGYRSSRPPVPRYRPAHFIIAILLLAIFSTAHYLEAEKYKKRVYEFYINLPKTAT